MDNRGHERKEGEETSPLVGSSCVSQPESVYTACSENPESSRGEQEQPRLTDNYETAGAEAPTLQPKAPRRTPSEFMVRSEFTG